LWLLTDSSHFSELETVNSRTNLDDTPLVIDFFNSVRDTKITMGDVKSNMSETSNILKELAISQKRTQTQLVQTHDQLDFYAKNLESHVKSVQQLGAGVEALTEKIGELPSIKKVVSSIGFLKEHIVVQNDVFKFRKEISGLSEVDKLGLTEWLFSKFGSLSRKNL